MDKDKLFEQAQHELEHQQRERMLGWAREHGRERLVTYAVEDGDGRPAGMSEYVTGACWLADAEPDPQAN
jgi:hypothetical protein